MEENKKENNAPEPEKEKKEQKELTPQQLQQRKKMIIFPLLFLLFAGCMWLIFAPSGDKNEEHTVGFNTDLPTPKESDIVTDKKDAYLQEAMETKQQDKMRSLQDFAFTLGDGSDDGSSKKVQMASLPPDNAGTANSGYNSQRTNAFQSSSQQYQDINRQLGSFYEKPATEADEQAQLALEWRIQELERKVDEEEARKSEADEQVALIEKSYEIAAKYMPIGQNQGNASEQQNSGLSAEEMKNKITKKSAGEKTKVAPIRQVNNQVVSNLIQHFSNDDLITLYDQPRNFGFNTVDAKAVENSKNTILACVQGDQTLLDGESVRLRLLEPLMAGETHLPINSIITGLAKIQGERLEIIISSLEYKGEIISVEMQAYDTDAQRGIYIPGSLEMNAIKEIGANMGQSMGTSISITDNAGSQIASDLSRGLIQGTSQYLSKKIKQVKVTLKSGYKMYLLPKENN